MKKLIIYKGFGQDFLSKVSEEALLDSPIEEKLDFQKLTDNYQNRMNTAIFDKRKECWLTYEEFTLDYETLMTFVTSHQVEITIINNNMYPGIYPCQLKLEEKAYEKYRKLRDNESSRGYDELMTQLDRIYSDIVQIGEQYYCYYYNYEVDNASIENIKDYYKDGLAETTITEPEYIADLIDDLERYIEHADNILQHNYKQVAYRKIGETKLVDKMIESLRILCKESGVESLGPYNEPKTNGNTEIEEDLIKVAEETLKIPDFKFRQLKFYKNPDFSNEIEEVSQGEIMSYIVKEAEKAYNNEIYRDIFITAPTGAGKSLIFQLPAIHLANKYGKLVIIIEPLKALMNDQQANLDKAGYKKSAYLNSDIATIAEREKILKDVSEGRVDLLYVSPETLLSHSIDSLVGEREIGLVIVDEAHIVTTWGVGFRPDYWYLGAYINRLRAKRDKNMREKAHHNFPIFACTATAVNGGKDDTVSDTYVSLYMKDPLSRIGYIKRDDIKFEINNQAEGKRKSQTVYQQEKLAALEKRLDEWVENNEKTIVYCPYARIARQMKDCDDGFRTLGKFRQHTGLYTGGLEIDKFLKNEYMEKFKDSQINIMYATKAFGMGIDISDINNVYHYAVTGGLSDYVQEVGRVARKEGMEGKAIVDYFDGDMQYMNSLFGMSQIRQYQVKKCLSILYDTYQSKLRNSRIKNPRSFMVSPEMFRGAFGKKDDVVAKLKIVLLMLEKDLTETYGVRVMVSRPGSMFTKAYVAIDSSIEKRFLHGKYGEYFKLVSGGRKKEPVETANSYWKRNDGEVTVTDAGNIYEVDLKNLWQHRYSEHLSFAAFKYRFFSKNRGEGIDHPVMPEHINQIYSRLRLTLQSKTGTLDRIYTEATEAIDFISSKLSEFGNDFFTKEQFKQKLMEKYHNAGKAELIAGAYLDVVDYTGTCVAHRRDSTGESFQLRNGNIRNLANALISKSVIISQTRNNKKLEYSKFLSDQSEKELNVLKLLSVLDLIVYELTGGSEPEIYIRLFIPEKIKNIVEERTVYSNSYVETARKKHYRSVKIIDYFFRNLKTNEERWDYIESYFLGEDIAGKIESEENSHKREKAATPLAKCIDREDAYSLEDYHNWDDVYKELVREEKYKYFCQIMAKAKITLPDYAVTNIKASLAGHKKIQEFEALFIYEKKNLLILQENVPYYIEKICAENGWKTIKINEIEDNLELLK